MKFTQLWYDIYSYTKQNNSVWTGHIGVGLKLTLQLSEMLDSISDEYIGMQVEVFSQPTAIEIACGLCLPQYESVSFLHSPNTN